MCDSVSSTIAYIHSTIYKRTPHEYAKYCNTRLLFFVDRTQVSVLNDLIKANRIVYIRKPVYCAQRARSTVSFDCLELVFSNAYNFFPVM